MMVLMNTTPQGARVSLFGGSFNPPHLGHVWMTATALSMLDVDEVWWLPAARHAFGKVFRFDIDERLHLCSLATAPFNGLAKVLPPPLPAEQVSYSYEELEALQKARPDLNIRLLVGADVAASLERFHRAPELLERWGVDVVGRVGYELPELPGADLHYCDVELPNVSSSEVRERLDRGESCLDLLPRAVWERIRKQIRAR